MTPRRLIILTLTPLLMLQGVRVACAECPPVVVPEVCERNLRALESANRKLDQKDGQIAQEQASHQDTRDALGEAHEEIGRLEAEQDARWSPWVWMGIGAGGALASVLLVALIAR